MIKDKERHFNAIRWMISCISKEEPTNNLNYNDDTDDEDWGAIKAI